MATTAAARAAKKTHRRAAAKARDSQSVELAARLGMAARGTLYLVVAVLAARLAIGRRSEPADSHGAVASVSHQPLGRLLVVVLALGLLAYALWRLLDAAFGRHDGAKGWSKRAANVGRAALYGTLFVMTIPFALGSEKHADGSQKEQDFTATVLGWPAGRAIVVGVGLAVIASGLYQGWRGLAGSFRKKFDENDMPAWARAAVRWIGLFGHAARMVVFAAIGMLLVRAALRFDPREAEGIDGALQRMADEPYGPTVLLLVAVGLAAFGCYTLAEARWRKVLE